MKNTIENIFNLARTEAMWLKYYGCVSSREKEQFNDILFYDRMTSIGYCKRRVPLTSRCPMGLVQGLNVNDFQIVNGSRNHVLSVYTALEFVIYNKIEGYDELIKIIKG